MQIVLIGNRVVAHGEDCFLCMGGTVICEETGKAYPNATVAEVDAIPADIDKAGYEYHAGVFVPCAPYGVGDGNIAVVCDDCKSIKDSGKPLSEVLTDISAALPKSGGTMTGPILVDGKNSYTKALTGRQATYTNLRPAFWYNGAASGIVAINLGNYYSFMAADVIIASSNSSVNICFSGAPMGNGAFNWTRATGTASGVSPKVRVAGDANGNCYLLVGEVDTYWEGYVTATVTNIVKYSLKDEDTTANVSIAFVTSESQFTNIREVPFQTIVPYNPTNLSAPVPIEKGGTGASSVAGALLNLGAACITTGSYTGTNKCGESNPNSLTFDFEPKLLFVAPSVTNYDNHSTNVGFFVKGSPVYMSFNSSYGLSTDHYGAGKVTWSGNTVSWSANHEAYQLNDAITYHYVAIG